MFTTLTRRERFTFHFLDLSVFRVPSPDDLLAVAPAPKRKDAFSPVLRPSIRPSLRNPNHISLELFVELPRMSESEAQFRKVGLCMSLKRHHRAYWLTFSFNFLIKASNPLLFKKEE